MGSVGNGLLININISGVLLGQKLKNMPLEYCIAAKKADNCEITYNCQFYPENEQSGTDLWQDLYKKGKLTNKDCNYLVFILISSCFN